jgi:asparagine synthase (glutamine-hydrolysing)
VCGWVGFWERDSRAARELDAQALCMVSTLTHRGPDDSGVWSSPDDGLSFGFRRLSIVDLSREGHQPMLSESERYVIVFNGEIYNFRALRLELEPRGHRFRGHSDTEVMLAAIEQWGLQHAVMRLEGMFSFALWDRRERCLSLVRDRLGIKPLYYGWMGQTLVCGSELKALRAYSAFRPTVDRDSLTLYMRHGYIPAPYSIYQGVRKLTPGCVLTLPRGTSESATPVPYWSAKQSAEWGAQNVFRGSPTEAEDELERILLASVKRRMVADVSLGAFLSGGIDSSLVVSMMQSQSAQSVKTFTIGFYEDGYDEAKYARAVSQHLGTDHAELYVTPSEGQAVIPSLPEIYDEPFADSSQIPTLLVSKLARASVTVSLTGDGGDELFGGYSRYSLARSIWEAVRWLPLPVRTLFAPMIRAVPGSVYNRLLSPVAPFIGRYGAAGSFGGKLHALADVLSASQPEALYHLLVSQNRRPAEIVVGGSEPPTPFTDVSRWAELPTFLQQMMYLDTITYLPDDILVKVDRASMAVSLEARVPFLDDPELLSFVARLPLEMKMHQGVAKLALRQVLYRYLPPEMVERPKMGFGVPVGKWLRGPLRCWAETLLDESRLRQEGFLEPAPVRRVWRQHLSGERNGEAQLWAILMFQAWMDRWGCSGAKLAV